MKSYGIEQARGALGEIVDDARFNDEPTVITRHDRPVAVVVSTEWLAAAVEYITHAAEQAEARRKWNVIRSALLAGHQASGLPPGYERAVHHLDGDPLNNDPENLQVRDAKDNDS